MTRDEEARTRIQALVRTSLGREIASVEAIEAGLGSRRFFRVSLETAGNPDSLVARLDGPEDPALRPEGVPPEPDLEPIRSWLARHDLPVPRSYGSEAGLVLLEDLGPTSLESAARSLPEEEVRALYRQACEIVPKLQAVPPPEHGTARFERRLDRDLIRYKAEQFVEWVLPLSTNPTAKGVVRDAFDVIADEALAAPQRLAHRDYKAANLQVHAGRLVMIDLQGAFLAPPEYDLVCLLRDSQVPIAEDFVEEALERTRPQLPDAPHPDAFARRFTLLTLSRNGKDLSRFLWAAAVRGDERYLSFVPRAVASLQSAAARAADWHPSLARLADVITSLPEAPCAR